MSVAWVGAAVAVYGAVSSANASEDAADSQANSAREAGQLSDRQFNLSRQDNLDQLKWSREAQQPWLTQGTNALAKLAAGYGLEGNTNDPAFGAFTRNGIYSDPTPTAQFTAQDLANDPVYNSGLQFGLDQGVQGINRQASAQGSLNSGATLKALTRFGNDYASTKANESYNRFNTTGTNKFNQQQANVSNQFNRDQITQGNERNGLASLAGIGQTSAQQLGTQGLNTAQVNSSLGQAAAQYGGDQINNAGSARAAGAIGSSNAINAGIGQGYNMYQGNRLLSGFLNKPSSTSSSTTGGSGYFKSNDIYDPNAWETMY